MANTTKIHFYPKSGSADVPQIIYMTFSFSCRFKLSIGKKITIAMWDKKSERCFVGNMYSQQENRSAKQINRFLDYLEVSVSDFLSGYDCWRRNGGIISQWHINRVRETVVRYMLDYGKKEIAEEKKKEIKPSEYFLNYIENMTKTVIKRTGTFRQKDTQGHHNIVFKRYMDFLSYSRWADDFSIFGEQFEAKFEYWGLSERNYAANTIAASFSILKVWLNQAEKQDLIKDPTFHGWKTKANGTEHIYLNEVEIKRIYDIDFSDDFKTVNKIDLKSKIEQTRDLFVIACHLGLRLSDWNRLSSSEWNFVDNTITINTTKTKERITVPLSTFVKELYGKYEGRFPNHIDKGHLNRQLEKIGELAHIDSDIYMMETRGGVAKQVHYKKYQLISSHTGRRSFATNLYLKCKQTKLVMAFTGHKTEENFFKYICIGKKENADIAQQYFE